MALASPPTLLPRLSAAHLTAAEDICHRWAAENDAGHRIALDRRLSSTGPYVLHDQRHGGVPRGCRGEVGALRAVQTGGLDGVGVAQQRKRRRVGGEVASRRAEIAGRARLEPCLVDGFPWVSIGFEWI